MRIVNLSSGSKGNVTFVKAGGVRLLVDAGLSVREIQKRLESIGEKLEDIDALLLTHEHSDHVKSFLPILKKFKAHGYAHEAVISGYLRPTDQVVIDKLSAISAYPFSIGEVDILPVPLPHDAIACLGYVLKFRGKKVGIITDLGFMPEVVLEVLEGCDLLFIESNHDSLMLKNCFYPRVVKERIASTRGHLSNDQAAAVVAHLAKTGTKYFVLSHISENSNTLEKAFLASAKALEKAGFELEKDVFIRYSRQDRPGNNFYLGGEDD